MPAIAQAFAESAKHLALDDFFAKRLGNVFTSIACRMQR
ncbi:LysR family transcriptional regulator [Mycobacteroides abscessus subsp. abscessus]|nr:LysR family transcriptional regulator [Mycobacteroides abscessus subsp. abscessus]